MPTGVVVPSAAVVSGESIRHQIPKLVQSPVRNTNAFRHLSAPGPVAPRSPWQNAYVERVIESIGGSIRRELLDHVIVTGEGQLRRLLRDYADYYNDYRTHLGLNKDTPLGRPVHNRGRIKAVPKLGGLHHAYVRI